MMNDLRNMTRKHTGTLCALCLVLIANAAVLLDVPILRETLTIILTFYLPGRMLTHLFLRKLSQLEIQLASLGISVAYVCTAVFTLQSVLMAVGIERPLETVWVLTMLDVAVIPLMIIIPLRTKGNHATHPARGKPQVFSSWKILGLALCCGVTVLPFLAIIGGNMMRTTGENAVLILVFLMLLAYTIILFRANQRVTTGVIAYCILLISCSSLLAYSMSSRYFMGEDIYVEYYAFKVTRLNGFWSMSGFESALTASLSTSLLPSVVYSLSNINDLLVYKLVYPLVFASIPVFSYAIFLRFFNSQIALIGALIVIFQIPFMFLLTHQMRVAIAIVLLAACLMIILRSTRADNGSKLIIILLGAGIVMSYYVTPIIFLIVLLALAIGAARRTGEIAPNRALAVNPRVFVILLVFHYFWWLTITGSDVFGFYTRFIGFTGESLLDLLDFSSRGVEVKYVFSPGGEWSDVVRKIVTQVILVALSLTIIVEISRTVRKRARFHPFLVIGSSFWILLVIAVVLPFVSVGYGGDRLFIQVFPFLSASFAVGIVAAVRKVKLARYTPLVLLAVVCFALVSNAFILDQAAGIHRSPILNQDGRSHDVSYVYVEEVTVAGWMLQVCPSNSTVYADLIPPGTGGVFDLAQHGYVRELVIIGEFFEKYSGNETGYLLLRHANVVNGMVYGRSEFTNGVPISDFAYVQQLNAIIDCGGAQCLTLSA